ncbi:ABC transporter ATP-binding protein [Ramlibacter sp. AW1]|uniref:ABC transporter ATP-binding protein n=1 Tax=Ramlibacter aurantiacus TaxID=2801330 RepID=A0A937D5T1_9BURK|nr:ABC transporter ATP-binding protein [Ramlibacter aurantiacus]MBL0421627.1 ABC transporter ATP-binding protein [Ramlibacter aurantiacus]
MNPMLKVEGISKTYGAFVAVQDVSFEVNTGELVAIIGPNGAGKSTCFNMLSGQHHPSAGRVWLEGRDITRAKPREIWRMGVGRTFQIAATYHSMTVVENVEMALLSRERRLYHMWKPASAFCRDEALSLLDSIGMAGQAHRPCSELAYGDIKRLELAIALANRPRLLLMDEPAAGMGPRERNELMALTKRLVTERDMAVLFTEHSMDVVFAYADRTVVLARGKLIAEGTPPQVRANPRVQEVYFGSGKSFEAQGEEVLA